MRKFLECFQCPRSLIIKLTSSNFEDIKLAIWKLQIDKIEQLLSEGAPTHQKGQTILHFAASQNRFEAVQFISGNCYDLINERNEDGDTPLMLALFSGHMRIVKYLISITNLNIRDNNGNTVFIIAAANGNIPVLQMILESPCSNTAIKNFEGQNALHRAAYYGELETIKFLLSKTNLKLCQTDKNNNNCLHLACLQGNIVCIRYIISKVRNPKNLLESKNKEGKKPLQILEHLIAQINLLKKYDKNSVNMSEIYNYIFEEVKIDSAEEINSNQ